MSSPIRRTNSRSSPSRHTPNGFRRSQANGFRSPYNRNGGHSPYHNGTDSPSRLLEEFGKIYLDEEKAFRKKLDDAADEQEKLHLAALEKSLKEHEAIRESAERARERLEMEMERAKAQKVADERAELEQSRKEAAEAQAAAKQRELDAVLQREEAERQVAQKQKQAEEAQQRIEAQRKQDAENKAKQEAAKAKEEADRKAKEEADAKQRAAEAAAKTVAPPAPQQPQQPTPQQSAFQRPAPQQTQPQTNGVAATPALTIARPTGPTINPPSNGILAPTAAVTPMQQCEAEHKRYLDLHKRLKEMRTDIEKQAKQGGITSLGDMRRELQKQVGQLNKGNKANNKTVMQNAKKLLLQAAQMQQPMVDVTPYLISVPPEKLKQGVEHTQYPALLLFLLNHLAKACVRQLIREASLDSETADPVGIIAVTLFSTPEFTFNGHSLIDVLWAKYHKLCPVLFGIYGPENTMAGRRRLGWRVVDGTEVGRQEHDFITGGLAAGFNAITLRDFSKSKNASPAPVHLFWTALARIINVPNDQQTTTHYQALYFMLKHCIPRFPSFYGSAALAALRKACGDFPSKGGPRDTSGAGPDSRVRSVQGLPDSWRKEHDFSL